MEEVCLHPRQRGWAAGAGRRGVFRGYKKTALRVREGRAAWGWGEEDLGTGKMGAEGGQDQEVALKLKGSHLGTLQLRIVWVWSKAQGGLKLYVIFSYTRDPPVVQMVSITGGKKRLCWYA